VPVNRLIVVDGGSTDGTIEVVKNYNNIEVFYDIEGTRGSARQIGILKANTEWFFFLDSDVILHDGWFEKARKFMQNSKVGAIQGSEISIGLTKDMSEFAYAIDKLAEGIKRRSVDRIIIDTKSRGFTGCVLIRRKAVDDIKIPSKLHDYEDWFIKRYIEERGYQWLINKDLKFTHFHRGGKPEDNFYISYIATFTGFLSLRTVLRRTVTIIPKVLFALCLRPNFKIVSRQIKSQLYTLVGCLKCELSTERLELESKLEIGAGRSPTFGFVHQDIRKLPHIEHVCDAKKLPFPDNRFKEIRAVDVLEHFEWRDIRQVLKEWNRVLRPNGLIYIQCPNVAEICRLFLERNEITDWEKFSYYMFGAQDYPENTHKTGFDMEGLSRILNETGYKVQKIQSDGGTNILCWAKKKQNRSPSI